MVVHIIYRTGLIENIADVARLRISEDALEIFTYDHRHESTPMSMVGDFRVSRLRTE